METIPTAILSTAPYLPGFQNGWHQEGENRVFVAQPAKSLDGRSDYQTELTTLLDMVVAAQQSETPFERIFVYFDKVGGEEILARLHRDGFDPTAVTFVFCGCTLLDKFACLLDHEFSGAIVHRCGCGGVDYLSRLYCDLIETGHLRLAS